MVTLEKIKTVHVFRVTLDRGLYRDLAVRSSATLESLAEAIINAYHFNFDHAFGFYDNIKNPYNASVAYELFYDLDPEGQEDRYPECVVRGVKKTRLETVFTEPKQTMSFLFDYGDDWIFKVKLLAIQPVTNFDTKRFPVVLARKGEAPKQYPDLLEDVN
jgi:hypothetical protein